MKMQGISHRRVSWAFILLAPRLAYPGRPAFVSESDGISEGLARKCSNIE